MIDAFRVWLCGPLLTCGTEQVQQEGPLVALLHPHHLLSDVLRGGAHTAHRQEDILFQEIPC